MYDSDRMQKKNCDVETMLKKNEYTQYRQEMKKERKEQLHERTGGRSGRKRNLGEASESRGCVP